MPGGLFSTAKLFGMTVRESATDGSDFTNPDADYRRLFLGEDGQLHVKDSAGAVTDIGGGGTGIPATIVDAKGDLIVATAADTVARLAIGATNGDELIVASGETTGFKYRRHIFCRKTASEAFSSTSFADSANMGLAVAASKVYKFRYVIFYNTNATSVSIKLALIGPSAATAYCGSLVPFGAGGSVDTVVASTLAAADITTDMTVFSGATGPGTANVMAILEGIVTTDVTAGTLQLRHASETATATTIATNSHGELIEIA